MADRGGGEGRYVVHGDKCVRWAQRQIRSFGTMSDDLAKLRDWLTEQGVTHVAMESTGSYWKPVVRHEALFDREGMKGPLLRAVAAAR
jgi:hypothetical protein